MKKIYTCIHAQVIQNFTTLSRIEIFIKWTENIRISSKENEDQVSAV